MKDLLRTLFRIRQQRKRLPVTPAPKIGATIICNGIKMKLTQSADDELWGWLLLMGWRVSPVRNDRRQSVLLPLDTFSRLRDASVNDRELLLENLVDAAREAA